MNNIYFVMLTCQNGDSTPLMKHENIMFFNDVEDARDSALSTVLGSEFGFEVFELGDGCYAE